MVFEGARSMTALGFSIGTLIVGAATAVGVEIFRRMCLAYGWFDVPNERSSHTIPTPRGGGTAIVVTVTLGALFFLGAEDAVSWIFGPAVVIALLGFIDDRIGIRAGIRLGVQLLSAAVALYLIRHPQSFELDVVSGFHLVGWAGFVFATLFVAWMTNLYNFMDGIDGIEAVQVVTVAVVSAVFCAHRGDIATALAFAVLSAGAAGFLPLNWSPARIFMGDVASGFFGFVLAVLAIHTSLRGGLPFEVSLILNGTFLMDTMFTLVRRTSRGEKPYQAHRLHAYQKLTQSGWSHRKMSSAYGLVNVLWLAPIGWAVLSGMIPGWIAILVAYLPLLWVCVVAKAGSRTS